MKPARIHRTALGGFSLDGPYYMSHGVSRGSILFARDMLARFFHWLGA